MNKYLSKIVGAVASLALVIGVGVGIASNKRINTVEAASPATLTFAAACGGSGTDSDGNTWTVASDAAESSFDSTKGIHYGTSKVEVSYLTISTSSISGTVTQIVVNASGASGTSAVLNATVGGNAFGTEKALTSSAATYTLTGSSSGSIQVAITQESAKKALYCKSISVTYSSGTVYTLTYDANGGTGTMTDNSSPYTSGSTVTVLDNTFTRDGYTFNHWNTAADDSETNYANGATFNISANTTLYAQWTKLPLRVTYNSNGATSGSVPIDETVYAENASVTVSGNTGTLARTGYIWAGWNTKADGTGISYAASSTFNISLATTLYARWISDYSNTLKVDITAPYLNLPVYASAYTSETTVHADDGMEYVVSPNSGNKVYAITSAAEGTDHAFDSSAESKVFMGKEGAYIYNKDPFQKNIEKVEVYAAQGCSTKVSASVDLGTTVRSSSYSTSPTTLNTQNRVYTLRDNEGSNNYRYFRLQVANDYNANIQIRITFYNPTTSVTVTPSSVTLNPTDTQQLTTVVEPVGSTDELVYTTSNSGVATVSDSGLITAFGVGTATITATSGSYSDTCEVTVELPLVPYITPTKNSTSGFTGQNETISFDFGNLNDSVAVVSNDPAVVTVSDLSRGATSGTVRFNFVGNGSTTVSFKDGSTDISSVSVSVTRTTVSLNKNSTSIYVGRSETLVATTNVGGVTWTSNNAKITVVDGVVSVAEDAAYNSTAIITATSNVDTSVSATCTVTALEDTRWDNNFTITKVASIELPDSGDTANKYYVVAEITSITNDHYGNGTATDEDGTEFTIYGMYSYDGQIGYDKMPTDIKPVAGDVVVLYGAFRNNEGPQIRNSRVIQRNGDIKFTPRVNLDLSTDTTASASTTSLVWTVTGQFSMNVAKGTATTDTNNYYPGTSGHSYTQTRLYKNSILTFTPASGVNVTRVSFYAATESYATAFADSAFTNATAVASGSLVVVTPVDGTSAFTVNIGGTCGFTGIDMYYNQTIKEFIENKTNTTASLSYTGYTDNGDDTFSYTNLAIRFKGMVDKDLWDILNAEYDIEGYGILFAETDDLSSLSIEDWYRATKDGSNTVDEALAELSSIGIVNYSNTSTRHEPALKSTPTLVDNNYVWALYLSINYSDSATDFSALAYIKIDGDIVFLNEISTYAAELADDLIENGTYEENAFGGSLKYLAGRP